MCFELKKANAGKSFLSRVLGRNHDHPKGYSSQPVLHKAINP
jgi:hypothetical protein